MEFVSPAGSDKSGCEGSLTAAAEAKHNVKHKNSGCDSMTERPAAAEVKHCAKQNAITLVLATGLLSGVAYTFYKQRIATHAAANLLLSDGVMTWKSLPLHQSYFHSVRECGFAVRFERLFLVFLSSGTVLVHLS